MVSSAEFLANKYITRQSLDNDNMNSDVDNGSDIADYKDNNADDYIDDNNISHKIIIMSYSDCHNNDDTYDDIDNGDDDNIDDNVDDDNDHDDNNKNDDGDYSNDYDDANNDDDTCRCLTQSMDATLSLKYDTFK